MPSSESSSHPDDAGRLGELNRILILDTDNEDRRTLQVLLRQEGCDVSAAAHSAAAARELDKRRYDALFCDVSFLGSGGATVLDRSWTERDPLVIALAAAASPAAGLDAVDRLAFDCLFKPFDRGQLSLALRRADKFERLRRERFERLAIEPELRPGSSLAGMVGASAVMQALFRTIEKVAQHKANVLLTGESGTGKELVARAMHQLGPRASKPFVAINCGAIPATLLESELFGHRRGAFTDAVRDKLGLFEEADGGTLFLDEIGELSTALQVKLLRAIQEEEIRRIGDNTPIHIDVRVISATLLDLSEAIKQGRFREDLFYRLNVLPIALPPLRDRKEDIPLLVDHFLRSYREKHATAGMAVEGVSEAALRLLCDYPWPGNIRELENTIERAMVLCEGPAIEVQLLEDKFKGRQVSDPIRASLATDELSIKKTTRIVERELIRRALESTTGNRTNAAKLLEISHRALLYKIKEYGL